MILFAKRPPGKPMNVGLVDVDESSFPNLALMKISTMLKKRGEKTELTGALFASSFDAVYGSKCFTWSPLPVLPAGTIFGGPGFNPKVRLPDDVEHMRPDYSLYPGLDFSLGFATRGCPRRCPWCVVPEKEGRPKINADIHEFWDPSHKEIKFLDNNILAVPDHFRTIATQCIKEKLIVDFNQGLDVRLMTKEAADLLRRMRYPKNGWKIAFDSIVYEKAFRRGIETMAAAGIPTSQIMVYVLVGLEDYDSTLRRIQIVHEEYKANPWCMFFIDPKTGQNPDRKPWMDLIRWTNRAAVRNAVPFERYFRSQHVRDLNDYPGQLTIKEGD